MQYKKNQKSMITLQTYLTKTIAYRLHKFICNRLMQSHFNLIIKNNRKGLNPYGYYVSLVIQEGFEPPTHGLEGRCSIQLSY